MVWEFEALRKKKKRFQYTQYNSKRNRHRWIRFHRHGSCSVCVLLQYFVFYLALSFSFSLCRFAMFLFQFRMFLNMSHIWYGQESFYGCMRQSAKCIFFFILHCICKTVLNYDIYIKRNEAINNEMNVYVKERWRME